MDKDDLLNAYLAGLWPEFSEDILATETISRSADFREDLQEMWDELTDEEREQVAVADRNLVAHAAEAAPYYLADQTAEDRVEENQPLSHWWWWVDKIADGSMPAEYLPG